MGIGGLSIGVNIVVGTSSRSSCSRTWEIPVSSVSSLGVCRLGDVGDDELADERIVTPEHMDNLALLLSSKEEGFIGEIELSLLCCNSLKRKPE